MLITPPGMLGVAYLTLGVALVVFPIRLVGAHLSWCWGWHWVDHQRVALVVVSIRFAGATSKLVLGLKLG
jgi:hypothetical protein